MNAARPARIGLCGEFQVGKSLLLNRLLGRDVALVGDLLATTPFPVSYGWGERPKVSLLGPIGVAREFACVKSFVEFLEKKHATTEGRQELDRATEAMVNLEHGELERVTLIDMPGFNASSSHDDKASFVLKTVDFAIFVTANRKALLETELKILRAMKDAGVPFLMIVNCFSDDAAPNPADPRNERLAKHNMAQVRNGGLAGLAYSPRSASKKADFLRVNIEWLERASVDQLRSEMDRDQNREVFDRLRRFIFGDSDFNIGLNGACLATFYRSLKEWHISATEVVERIQSTFNG